MRLQTPVLYSELFRDLIFDSIPDSRDDWDNLAKDEKVDDIESAEDCREACGKNTECFQSLYNGEECNLGTKSFKIGEKHKREDGKKWQSSWNRTRIEDWALKQKPCGSVEYPFEE